MRRLNITFILVTSMLLFGVSARAQQTDSKRIVDIEPVSDSFFYLDDSIMMPLKQADFKNFEKILRELPGVYLFDDGNVYLDENSKIKVSSIYFRGKKEIEFFCSDYSLVYVPPVQIETPVVIGKIDGKGSRPLTQEEMRESGMIGIPIPLPEGETVESYLLKQPGVHKDEEGNIIYPNGRKLTPEEIELSERDAHISWQDSLLKYQQKYQQQNK